MGLWADHGASKFGLFLGFDFDSIERSLFGIIRDG